MSKQFLSVLDMLGFNKIETKNFKFDLPPVGEGEEVIGELNDLEKACYVFQEEKEIKHKELHSKLRGIDRNSEEGLKLCQEHSLLRNSMDIAKNIMRASIVQRLGVPKNSKGLTLREGTKIVSITQGEEYDFDTFFGGIHGFGSLGGMMIIEMGVIRL